jgi:hypothetical protein
MYRVHKNYLSDNHLSSHSSWTLVVCLPRAMTGIQIKATVPNRRKRNHMSTQIHHHTVTAVSICDDERKGVKSDNTLTLEMAKAIDTHEGRSISI